jgi:copper chaperone CopZ
MEIGMLRIVMNIDGMMCGMCESHINDAVRKAFRVKKVTSSHKRGETVILSEQDITDEELKGVIGQTGYELKSVTRENYEKRGFWKR